MSPSRSSRSSFCPSGCSSGASRCRKRPKQKCRNDRFYITTTAGIYGECNRLRWPNLEPKGSVRAPLSFFFRYLKKRYSLVFHAAFTLREPLILANQRIGIVAHNAREKKEKRREK